MMHPESFEPFARTIVGALGVGIAESALLAFAWGAVSALNFGFAGVALVALWLAGSALGLAALLRSFVTLRALNRNASPLDEAVFRRLRRWRHASRAGRSVALAVSNEIDV